MSLSRFNVGDRVLTRIGYPYAFGGKGTVVGFANGHVAVKLDSYPAPEEFPGWFFQVSELEEVK